ncbi:hypothetical protein KUTeg_021476 [Tegillarca granosa]|uniref:Uncharacterized protein n=1 Tax=Tegillarca granosa TaxID=220873 RepID=A0ABQ9E7U9_TEGGR|nr:hypothetical protein KUTeg_021476 [Tegillarca granosa]
MQIRVSPDYHSQADQWKIGVTSILADAVGLVPYKDTFWTTTNQPGNPKYPTITEPYPSLEALVATLSTGPVGPGDKVNSTDVEMLMRYFQSQFRWQSLTQMGLLVKFGQHTVLYKMLLSSSKSTHDPIVFPYNDVSKWQVFNDSNPLQINNCNNQNFCLYHITVPQTLLLISFITFVFLGHFRKEDKVAVLGELNKWVPVSPWRIKKLTYSDDVAMKVAGEAGENVTMSYMVNDQIVNITCTVDMMDTIIIGLKDKSCSPEPTPIITPSPNAGSAIRSKFITIFPIIFCVLNVLRTF